MFEKNITFIGMPGSGKSTVGVVVAKMLCKTFNDTDLLIQNKAGKRLHKIIDEIGNERFLQLENDTLASLNVHNSIISTGGSAIFGNEAMNHLKKDSTVVYLKVPYDTLEQRLKSLKHRGVVFEEGQTLRDIYDIRTPLYEKYADIIIESNNELDVQETAMMIVKHFE